MLFHKLKSQLSLEHTTILNLCIFSLFCQLCSSNIREHRVFEWCKWKGSIEGDFTLYYCEMWFLDQWYMHTNYLCYILQNNVIIGRLPIMLKSSCCVLYERDEEELARYGIISYGFAIWFLFIYFKIHIISKS